MRDLCLMLFLWRHDIHRCQAHAFVQSEEQVHILYSLSGRSLDHIVDAGGYDDPMGTFIYSRADIAVICAHDKTGLAESRTDAYKLFLSVVFVINPIDIVFRHVLFQIRVDSSENAPFHRHEMRRELNLDIQAGYFGKFLFDLRRMSVMSDAIGFDGFTGFRIKKGDVLLSS